MTDEDDPGTQIAITAAAGRFAGAPDLDAFWRNLSAGVESVADFTDAQLLRSGVPADLLAEPRLVRRRPVLDGVEDFDAGFFTYTPREAETIDPQQRVFLECAWEALESSGHDARRIDGAVGVFGGGGPNLYYSTHILPNEPFYSRAGFFAVMLGNEKDFIAPRVSYKLNLRGPSISVLTGCSSSLVALHLACASLLSGETDFALAGGVTILLPQRAGYLFNPGGVNSPQGRCRAFDADADGTVPGDGAAVVLLRRLADALADGDPVLGIVRGSAVNNDGADKVGFTAPSVSGQADVIAEALAVADVAPETVGYIEAHGTGTRLGDAIEIAALTQAFGTDRRQFCRIGSVKANIGHTDTAAGVAGLIKILLAFRHEQLPPSINCAVPNPELGFERTPFRVNTTLSPWPAGGAPRRAGVSSFSVGGTNAHVVVEEPPARPDSAPPPRPASLLLVSARTPAALDEARARLADHLDATRPDARELADVAWTTQTGRAEFEYRHAVAAADFATAAAGLRGAAPAAGTTGPRRSAPRRAATEPPEVAFLFPGQGSQYVGMAGGLYATELGVWVTVDACAELLMPELGLDIRTVLFPAEPTGPAADRAADLLGRTDITQPALFVVEYAVARQLADWGVRPAAMLGHSLGELVAATLAGVFPLPTALRLVAARGRLIAELPTGSMAALALPEDEAAGLLDGSGMSLAAVNGPAQTVVSGPTPALEALVERLRADGVGAVRLRTSHAFHSSMMDPAVAPFVERVRAAAPAAPAVPFLSGVTGTWITDAQATDPHYWGEQLRAPVRFAAGAAALAEGGRVLVEVGPGTALARALGPGADLLASLGAARDAAGAAGEAALPALLGRLWERGVLADWDTLRGGADRRRLALPTYPFQRSRHWVEPPGGPQLAGTAVVGTAVTGTAVTRTAAARTAVAGAAVAGTAPAGQPAAAAAPAPAPTAAPSDLSVIDTPVDEAATDPVQAEIRRIWRDVMGHTVIGLHDSFFDLGGHSLLAAQIVARIETAFPIRLTVAEILGDVPTVASMAAVVDRLLHERLTQMSDEEVAALLAEPLLAEPAETSGPANQERRP